MVPSSRCGASAHGCGSFASTFCKAYDTVFFGAVWRTLCDRGVPIVKRVRYIQPLLCRRLRFRLQRHVSAEMVPRQGLPQGCPVPPSVFAAVVEDTLGQQWPAGSLQELDSRHPTGTFPSSAMLMTSSCWSRTKGEVEVMMKDRPQALLEASLRIQVVKGEYMVVCVPNDEVPFCPWEFNQVTIVHVLGMWVVVVDLPEEVLDRLVSFAWGVYRGIKDQLLQQLVNISDRIQLLESAVGGGLRYVWGVLSLTQALRQRLTALQITLVARLSTGPCHERVLEDGWSGTSPAGAMPHSCCASPHCRGTE